MSCLTLFPEERTRKKLNPRTRATPGLAKSSLRSTHKPVWAVNSSRQAGAGKRSCAKSSPIFPRTSTLLTALDDAEEEHQLARRGGSADGRYQIDSCFARSRTLVALKLLLCLPEWGPAKKKETIRCWSTNVYAKFDSGGCNPRKRSARAPTSRAAIILGRKYAYHADGRFARSRISEVFRPWQCVTT